MIFTQESKLCVALGVVSCMSGIIGGILLVRNVRKKEQ